jgi:uncharacterized ferritin-like protein (DUF455 family)
MELRAFALSLVQADTLEGKLAPPPPGLTDAAPGPALRVEAPGRPENLRIVPGGHARVPALAGVHDPRQRARVLHALANHELQAAELFAWALLAFPDAPPEFRRGATGVLADEQAHCRMYTARLAAHGAAFGDHPVSGHFWRALRAVGTPLEFVCTMGLTFENANLDFALEHAAALRAAGDEETARVLERVHHDEVAHVGFAWRWLGRFAPPGADLWEVYRAAVRPPHGPSRARGATFDRVARLAAGIDPAFVDRLERTPPDRPGGALR